MGNIQSSINQGIATIGSAVAISEHLKDRETARIADVRAAVETAKSTAEEIKQEESEAQQAILAHASKEGLSEDEIDRLKRDPSYANTLRDTVLAERRKEVQKLASDEYNEASKELDKYKDDKVLSEFEKGANITPEQYQKALAKEKAIDRMNKANKELNAAYESSRELNDRRTAMRKLQYNHDEAVAKIKARATKRELKNIGGNL